MPKYLSALVLSMLATTASADWPWEDTNEVRSDYCRGFIVAGLGSRMGPKNNERCAYIASTIFLQLSGELTLLCKERVSSLLHRREPSWKVGKGRAGCQLNYSDRSQKVPNYQGHPTPYNGTSDHPPQKSHVHFLCDHDTIR